MPKDIILATIGRCIYCGKGPGEAELTAEHIVPFALGGPWVLDEATCTSCQEITTHIEQNVLRPMLGPARARMNIRTRHKKDRKKPFRTALLSPDGRRTTIHVPSSELPAFLTLPLFETPGFLVGRSPAVELPFSEWWVCSFDTNRNEMYSKLNKRFGEGQFHLLNLKLDEFGRMLAKIAHGWSVAQLRFGNFYPFLCDIIRKEKSDVFTYVGGFKEIPPKGDGLFEIRAFYDCQTYGKFLTARIRLFTLLGAPVYNIVVVMPLTQSY